MAADFASVIHCDKRRLNIEAHRVSILAARCKATPRRKIGKVGNLAFYRNKFAPLAYLGNRS